MSWGINDGEDRLFEPGVPDSDIGSDILKMPIYYY